MKILHAADRTSSRWKNGGGITSEVAVFPADAGLTDFEWRISIAEIAKSGPFSRFDGVDRILTVLDGRLALHFDAGGPAVILGPGDVHRFSGEASVNGTPIDIMVRDLNVMVRRGTWEATVTRACATLPSAELIIVIVTEANDNLVRLDAICLSPGETLPPGISGLVVALDRSTTPQMEVPTQAQLSSPLST